MDTNEEILPSGGGVTPPVYEAPKKSGFGKGVFTGVLATLIIGGLVLSVGIALFAHMMGGGILDAGTKTKLAYLTTLIRSNFYENVDDEELQEGLYKGLIEGVDDPYSEYYTKKEYEDFQISTTGNYAGIGAQLSQDKDTMQVTISKIYDDSPAQNAGLRAGDEIISVDGNLAVEENLDAFVQRIRGEAGTTLELTYSRDGSEDTVTVTRDSITIPSVSHKMLDNGIGLIEISEFASNTQEEFDEALADLEKDGLKAIIFDLRANPGGMVNSVTDILDEILPEGTTVYMVDKKGEKTTYTSDEEHQIDYPMAVLTSANTASSAEIFAGAIRDFDYGTLIGEKTYGKGVVQSTFPMPDGSAVKLTIAGYYTPSGESIHKKGIKPDIELKYKYTGDTDAKEYDYSKDNQVKRAEKVLEKEMD
ncbi:MAG: S41 family peptidase [Lachnospiraceae bacterium]|nr:S41 family peptidase [Lachnospiraceae bacterium]